MSHVPPRRLLTGGEDRARTRAGPHTAVRVDAASATLGLPALVQPDQSPSTSDIGEDADISVAGGGAHGAPPFLIGAEAAFRDAARLPTRHHEAPLCAPRRRGVRSDAKEALETVVAIPPHTRPLSSVLDTALPRG